MKCTECGVMLANEIFIGSESDSTFCNIGCYLNYYRKTYDLGYYTTVKKYQEHLNQLERKYGHGG